MYFFFKRIKKKNIKVLGNIFFFCWKFLNLNENKLVIKYAGQINLPIFHKSIPGKKHYTFKKNLKLVYFFGGNRNIVKENNFYLKIYSFAIKVLTFGSKME